MHYGVPFYQYILLFIKKKKIQKQWDNEEEDDLLIPHSIYTYSTNPQL